MKNTHCKIFLFLSLLLALAVAVNAQEITQYASRLNYWDQESSTVVIKNTATETTLINISLPSGWTWQSGTSGCTNTNATFVQCTLTGGQSSSYTFQSPGSAPAEYTVSDLIAITNNSYAADNISFLRIHPSEVFHTLVEYGRGRGNYFFDSYNKTANVSGSGHSGIGCPYVPNATLFELNYLHKVLNIGHYLGLTSEGENVSFECTYPNQTVVRHHLTTSISRSGSNWLADYFISELQTSWERMGYLGQDFDSGEYATGGSIAVSCTNIIYQLPEANGNVTVGTDSFTLTVRDREPFNVSATAASTIYNGTQEVEITYTITNNEQYAVNDVAIEIQAPPYADFIGTRGELWGIAQDYFRFERDEFLPGESESITLVARFNTSTTPPAATSLNLSQGVSIEYITCWEANAYNPAEYIQDLGAAAAGTGTVDMNTQTSITGVQQQLTEIINILNVINSTVFNINSTLFAMNQTLEDIYNLTWWINDSTWNLSYKVWTYYSRNLTYYPTSTGGAGGGGTGGGFGSACAWNSTEHYNDSTTVANYTLVYGNNNTRVDFPNIYNDTVDVWRTCYKIAPQTNTDGTVDVFEIYACSDYTGGDPHTTSGCQLVDVKRKYDNLHANHATWTCSEILTSEVTGSNLTIMFECDSCLDTTDAWRLYFDDTVASVYSYNSTDSGSTWSLFTDEFLVDLGWCMPIDFGYEVWSYNNRTLTDYNFTYLFDQFNCSSGSSTNRMCELLEAINLTSSNMWATIQVINSTVNAIDGNVTLIKNDTSYIMDSLNCNGSVDTPICDKLDAMNLSIEEIRNITISINNTVYDINNTVYLMNQTMIQRFDGIDGNLTYIINLSLDLQSLINCTNISAQAPNSTCNRLERIETNSVVINTTVNTIEGIVRYINETRWNNLTANDLLDAINALSLNVSVDLTPVLRELERMREFDEELVFLVTDAFNLQQQARTAANSGDIDTAAAMLEQSKSKLEQATQRLLVLDSAFKAEQNLAERQSNWWVWVVVLAGMCTAFVYLFQKVPEEPGQPRQY